MRSGGYTGIMSAENSLLHEVAVTAIIAKDGKFLIMRRPLTKKRFPGKWTVPGGKFETSDFTTFSKDTQDYWYNVLERALRREVKEEVGLAIKNIEYVTSLAALHEDGVSSLVISCMADWESGKVKLGEGEADEYAWVTPEEAASYDLIAGIPEELKMAAARRRGERPEWKKGMV